MSTHADESESVEFEKSHENFVHLVAFANSDISSNTFEDLLDWWKVAH